MEPFDDSYSTQNTCDQSNDYSIMNALENTSLQAINTHLPDANDIRNMPPLLPIVKISDEGKSLENKHRTAIAKAVIDECLSYQPDRM